MELKHLYTSEKFDSLEIECRHLINQGKTNADVVNFLALAYKNQGKLEKAISTFLKGISRFPKSEFLLNNLANIYKDRGELSEAQKYLKKATELKPNNSLLHESLGSVLLERGELEGALKSLTKALYIDPNKSSLKYNIANTYRKLGKLDEAISYFEGIDIGMSQSHLADCLYIGKYYKRLVSKLDELNRKVATDPLTGAITEHARITLDYDGRNAFCENPKSYIYRAKIDLSGKVGKTLEEVKEFAKEGEVNFSSQTQQKLLSKGVQSPGNLLDSTKPFVRHLREILQLSVEAYRQKFALSTEPFLKNWPQRYKLYAWVIIVNNDGFLAPHIHKEGWISGTIYLELPKIRNYDEGSISFGLHGADYPTMNKTFKDTPTQIEEGMICMFPSSLFHRTIPFQSSQKRISLAFDVVPIR